MGLDKRLATVKRNLPSVARSLGFDARVTSAYRSTSKQAWLYNRWLAGLQEYPVAPPGTSDHERGLALDVVSTNPNKLVSLLTSAGLSWAGPDDPVHFSLKGLQSQATKKSATQAYREEVGYLVPAELTQLPFVGEIFGIMRDPGGVEKKKLSTLADVLLSLIGL